MMDEFDYDEDGGWLKIRNGDEKKDEIEGSSGGWMGWGDRSS